MMAADTGNTAGDITALEDLYKKYPGYRKIMAHSRKLYHELVDEAGAHAPVVVFDATPGKNIESIGISCTSARLTPIPCSNATPW